MHTPADVLVPVDVCHAEQLCPDNGNQTHEGREESVLDEILPAFVMDKALDKDPDTGAHADNRLHSNAPASELFSANGPGVRRAGPPACFAVNKVPAYAYSTHGHVLA